MRYKFENLDVWQLALDYLDLVYKIAENLPHSEEYNLKSQMIRAATSVALNIAEGSQGQSDAEQARFLGMAIRSLIETVACQKIIQRRNYFQDTELLQKAYNDSQVLARCCKASASLCHKRNIKFGKITPMKMILCSSGSTWSNVHGPSSPQVQNG